MTRPAWERGGVSLYLGDAVEVLRTLPDESIDCCVSSPPYWGLRDYGVDGQIGLEETPAAFVDKIVAVYAEVRRVLKSDGTCWVNLGDSYARTLDPFMGSGTVGLVAWKHGRRAVGIELNPEYLQTIAIPRLEKSMDGMALLDGVEAIDPAGVVDDDLV